MVRTYKWYEDTYGELASTKFKERYSNNTKTSKISLELFVELYNAIPDYLHSKTYFDMHPKGNTEYLITTGSKCYFYDFVIAPIKLCVEFNGDFWHANPAIYEENQFYETWKGTAKDKWKADAQKIQCIEDRGFDTIIVWESEYRKNRDRVIENILSVIMGKIKHDI